MLIFYINYIIIYIMGNNISSEDSELLNQYKNQVFKQGQTIQQQQLQINKLIQNLENDKTSSNLQKIERIQRLQQQQSLIHMQKLKNLQQQNNNTNNTNTNNNTQSSLQIENKIKLDPYKILNISKNYDIDSLKKAYLKKAMDTHPDRGGSPDEFKKVSIAFAVLKKNLKMKEDNDHNTLKNNFKKENEKLLSDNFENIKLDKNSFDINNFNKIYNNHKQETVYDSGYGGWMKKNDKNEMVSCNEQNFNSQFEKYKNSKKSNNSLEIYKPEELISCSNSDSLVTLGKGKIKNFSGESNGLQYRDLRDAYENSTLIDINSTNTNLNRNIHDIKSSRKNISYEMSQGDQIMYDRLQSLSNKEEQDRLNRVNKHDENSLLLYNKIHSRFIK